MNENRFFLWTKIFIKIKTRDKMKCSQKISWGGGQFSWGKINPGKYPLGKLPPIPQRKKKEKKRKLTPEKIISYVKCRRKKR